jgi:geranylgeranyl pyrophosphate synthase
MVRKVVTDGDVDADTWQTIKDLLRREGAIEAAFDRATMYAGRAKQHLLSAFPPSAERDGLVALADYVVNRDR